MPLSGGESAVGGGGEGEGGGGDSGGDGEGGGGEGGVGLGLGGVGGDGTYPPLSYVKYGLYGDSLMMHEPSSTSAKGL